MCKLQQIVLSLLLLLLRARVALLVPAGHRLPAPVIPHAGGRPATRAQAVGLANLAATLCCAHSAWLAAMMKSS